MKVLIQWVVAAWVLAVTADRPCAEYCIYLSSGIDGIAVQPECDCTYEKVGSQIRFDSGIYYEPVEKMSLLDNFHNRPFYIVNPIINGQRIFYTDNVPIIPRNAILPLINSRKFDTEMGSKISTVHATLKKKEKDYPFNNQLSQDAPLYLDINVESGDVERSASTNTFIAEELKLTEKGILECAHLYTALRSRSSNQKNEKIAIQRNEGSHSDTTELKQRVQNKCSAISYIINRSLNEIKKTRPKLTRVTYRLDSEEQHINVASSSMDIHDKNTLCPTNKSLNKSAENTVNNLKYPSQISSTTEVSTSEANTQTSSDSIADVTARATIKLTGQYTRATPMYKEKEYPLHKERTHESTISRSAATVHINRVEPNILEQLSTQSEYPLQKASTVPHVTMTSILFTSPSYNTANTYLAKQDISDREFTGKENQLNKDSAMTSEYFISTVTSVNTNTAEPEFSQNTDRELRTTYYEKRVENRIVYEEHEVPLAKIITHEFNNNTVQSFINGTEDVSNGDFPSEVEATEIYKETEDANAVIPSYQYTGSTPPEFGTTSHSSVGREEITTPDISGKLYFVFNNHQIPARFIQNLNGSLHLGIDGNTVCNTFTQNGEHTSVLLKTLCNCYKAVNGTQK